MYSEIFGDDAETFYDWGDALFEASDAVRVYGQAIAPYEFACVPTSLDAEFSLTELTDGDRRVGVRLQASIPDDQATGTFITFQFLLADPSARIEIWLDPVYDDESILDCVVDELGEAMGHDVSLAEAMRFIARIESIEHAVQIDEDLAPSRVVDLPIDPADWKSDGARFCEYLRRVMTDASKPVR